MKRKIVTGFVVVVILGALVGVNQFEPERVSDERQQAIEDTEMQIAQADAAAAEAAAEDTGKGEVPKPNETLEPVKESFKVKFECSNGDFVLEIHPEWAPNGAARFKEIIEKGIYDEARFFRVLPNFMAQWGIPADPEVTALWMNARIPPDPVTKSNKPGMISYAMLSGDNGSRTTQVFISTVNNARLDSMGFAPFGEVIEGMDVVKGITAEYQQRPDQTQIQNVGNNYLKQQFPNLDYIKKATIVE